MDVVRDGPPAARGRLAGGSLGAAAVLRIALGRGLPFHLLPDPAEPAPHLAPGARRAIARGLRVRRTPRLLVCRWGRVRGSGGGGSPPGQHWVDPAVARVDT